MNALRADFDQPGAAVHQTSSPARASSQRSAWSRWPYEVTLTVQYSLRLTGGAGRERDQARVLGRELGRRGRRARGGSSSHGHQSVGPLQPAPESAAALRSSQTTSAGRGDLQPVPQVVRAQLLGAREHDVALAEARDHRQDPLGPVAEQREHDVAAARAERVELVRRAVAACARDLAHRPLAAAAVAADRDERAALRRRGLDDVAGEVHARAAYGSRGWSGHPMLKTPPASVGWV